MTFWGKSLEFKPIGIQTIYLKKFDETYTYNRANSTIENILIGSIYIEQSGKMIFTNEKLGFKGILKMMKRGWIGLNAYKGVGEILKQDEEVAYTIEGKWDSDISATNLKTNEEKKLWQVKAKSQDNEK